MGAPPRMHALRMARELQLLSSAPPPGVAAWPHDDARLDLLDAEIVGAADTPYASGVFCLRVSVPPEYPLRPPGVRFVTKIYHPNIDSQGRICLDTLNMPPKGAWKPSLNIATVLASVQLLMSHPNPDDGLMADITDEFKRYPQRFHSTAVEWTRKYATGRGHVSSGPAGHVDCSVGPAASTIADGSSRGDASLANVGGPGAASSREKIDISGPSTSGQSHDVGLNTRGAATVASKTSLLASLRGPHPRPKEQVGTSSTSKDEITSAISDVGQPIVSVLSDGDEEEFVSRPVRLRKTPGERPRRRLRKTGAEQESHVDDEDMKLVSRSPDVPQHAGAVLRDLRETRRRTTMDVTSDSGMHAVKVRTTNSPHLENPIHKPPLPAVVVDLVDVDEPVVEEEASFKLTRLKRRRL